MIKCLDISNIKLISKNKKYGISRAGTLILTKEYRNFKKEIHFSCKNILTKINSPYIVKIDLETPMDIDASIQPILDGMQGKSFKNDSQILKLVVNKIKIKKGQLGSLKVWVGTLNE